MRPRIAINCDVEARGPAGGFQRDRLALYTDYLDAIYEAGGDPVILPPDLRALPSLERVDGVLLTGGDDYLTSITDRENPPPRYAQIHPVREEFDAALAATVLARDFPLLAICAGFQLIAIHGGGRIFGDIEEELGSEVVHRRDSSDQPHPRHSMRWEAPHPLGVHPPGAEVMSHHHQGVASLPVGWRAWGTAPDGVIEGAVGPGRWQVAVQWHPELSPREANERQLFTAFIEACRASTPGAVTER